MLITRNLYHVIKEKIHDISRSLFLHQRDIIVFSHLRWDFIFQRPQHIATKLAKKNKILFIEEPIPFHPLDRGKTSFFSPQRNITVIQPKIAREYLKQELPLVIAKQIRIQKMQNPVLWFYSPFFCDIVQHLNHSLIVYDFVNKERRMEDLQETYLFSVADVLFASEKIFFEKQKITLHNLHYLPQTQVAQDNVALQIQNIMEKILEDKKYKALYTKPFYHPFVPQISVGK